MLKKFSLICFLILSMTLIVGCADVNYRRIYSTTGTIIDEVYVSLDKETFSEGQAHSLYGVIKSDFDNYTGAIDSWIVANFGGKYVQDISVEEFIRKGIKTDITSLTPTADSYAFSFFIEFSSIEHFVYFYGLNTEDVIESYGLDNFVGVTGFEMSDFGPFVSDYISSDYMKDESDIFTTDYIWESDNAYKNFSLMTKEDGKSLVDYYCTRVNSIINSAFTEEEVLDKVNITQCFETDDSRFKSNSDGVYIDPELGYYMHVWNLSEDGEKSIEIYRALPVTTWWYVLAIVITGICIALMFVKAKKKDIDNENQREVSKDE